MVCSSQNVFTGIVRDGISKMPLPFATLKIGQNLSFVTDAEGKFQIELNGDLSISVSYVGYQTKIINVDKKNFIEIFLEPQSNALDELKVLNTNPAMSLLRKVILLKKNNNPQLRTKNFEFKAYNKLIVTANPDSISNKIDTVFIFNKIKKVDSTSYKFKKIVAKNHLFETEKVSLFQFSDGNLKETILGTKMAGFKQPIYEVLGFPLQSFSIYDQKYELLGKKFYSPIVESSIKKYTYKILDTVSIQNRKTVLIYFKSKNIVTPLEGVLYIDIANYGIAKAIFRNRTVLDVSSTYDFTFMPSENLWFPSANNFKIVKGKNAEDIKILGGTITFDGDENNTFKKRKREPSDYIYALSQTKNFDIQYNIPLPAQKKFVKIEIQNNAFDQPETF